MLKNYLKKTGPRRLLMMLIGNIILGLGIAIFKLSGLGNDPFSGMVMALSDRTGIVYANFLIILNLFLFLIQFLTGKHFIGAGTVVNALLLGYFVTFFYNILTAVYGLPHALVEQVIIVCIGVIITSLGLSLYQTPDVGVAPFDSLSLIMAERFPKIHYFWYRISTDAICALVCYLAGGIIGLGTLVSAFGFGPFVQFFNRTVAKKLLERR